MPPKRTAATTPSVSPGSTRRRRSPGVAASPQSAFRVVSPPVTKRAVGRKRPRDGADAVDEIVDALAAAISRARPMDARSRSLLVKLRQAQEQAGNDLLDSKLIAVMIDADLDDRLLQCASPVPAEIATLFADMFDKAAGSSPRRKARIDRVFRRLNDAVVVDDTEDSDWPKVADALRAAAADIERYGPTIIVTLRLAALRQLQAMHFDAFDTIVLIVELVRRCVRHNGLEATCAMLLDADALSAFLDAVDTSRQAHADLAAAFAAHDLSLPDEVVQ